MEYRLQSVYNHMGTSHTSDPKMSEATKVGQYKQRTYKRRTRTNVGLVQTLDWDKRLDQYTHVRLVQMSDGYIFKKKTSDFGQEKKFYYKKQLKL